MKQILMVFAMVMGCHLAQAQFTDLKGFTVQASTQLYIENNEPKSINVDQLYSFSLNDEFLVHNIYSDGNINKSQFYKLIEINRLVDGDITIFKLNAKSGISGNVFAYEVRIDKEGKLLQMVITQPDQVTKSTFKGGIIVLTTFKQ